MSSQLDAGNAERTKERLTQKITEERERRKEEVRLTSKIALEGRPLHPPPKM